MAVIENGGNAFLFGGASGTYSYLVLGGLPGHTGTVTIEGGFLTGPQATLGFYAGSSGTATISSGTWVNSSLLGVGYQGRGTVNLSGGLIQGNTVFGDVSTSTGIGNITGGLWNAPDYFVAGGHGTSTVLLAGGTVTSAVVDAGNDSGGRGTLTMSSGVISATNSVNLGQFGTGTMTVTGGTISTGNISLGYAASGKGTLVMSGGQFTVGANFNIGSSGLGTVTLSGGRIDSGNFWVSKGSALISGGTLVTGELDVASAANPTLNLTAGVIQTGLVELGGGATGGKGTVTVNGGTLNATSLRVGDLGTGTFNLTKGLVISSSGVILGVTATDSGALTISGSTAVGELQTSQVARGAGKGTVTFNGGALVATGDQMDFLSGFSAGDVKINAGGAILHSNGHDIAVQAQLSGVGLLEQQGAGSLTLTGSNTFTGGVIVNGGVIHVLNANALGAATNSLRIDFGGVDLGGYTVSVANLNGSVNSIIGNSSTTSIATLITNGSGTSNFQGFIQDNDSSPTGAVAIRKTGSGVLTLSGSNSYSGGTTISAGTLNLGGETALGTGGLFIQGVSVLDNISGTALALTTNNVQAWNANFTFKGSSSLDLGGGAVFMGASRSVAVNSSTLTVGGAISGATASTSLTKTGTGTLVLLGDSSYSGTTTISAGTLQLGNGGTSGSIVGTALVNSGQLIVDRGTDSSLSQLISGTGKLVKNGVGALFLNGANTYTGGTTLNAGGLVLSNTKALGAATADLTVNGGTLDLHDNKVAAGFFSGAGGQILNSGTGAAKLTINSAKSATFGGVLSDGSGGGTLAFEKGGTGILTLNGSNMYSGGTVLSGGGLNLGHANALGVGGLTISGVVTLDNTSGVPIMLPNTVFENWNANFTFKGSNDLDLGGGGVLMNATRTVTVSAGKLTVGGPISGLTVATGLVKSGTGTLILKGANTYGGSTTVTAGALQLDDGGLLGNGAIMNSGTFVSNHADDIILGNLISGAGKLVKNGMGSLTLTGSNAYTGGTTLNSGTLVLGHPKALGAATGALAINNGTLNLSGNSVTVGSLEGSGGAVSNFGASPASLTINSALNSTFSGSFTNDGNVLGVVKMGTGTLTLSGHNTFDGGFVLAAGGLNLGGIQALGTGTLTISGVSTIDNVSGSSMMLAQNNPQNWNANFTFKGSNDLNLGSGNVTMSATRTINVVSHTLFVDGSILGATPTTGLIKTGTGTLTLRGTSSYAGPTTVSAGILDLEGGTLGAGAIINSGTLILNHASDVTMANLISGAGRLVKSGTGQLILAGANTYTGGSTLNSGTLALGNAKGLGAATGDLTFDMGTLDLHGFSPTVGLLSGPGGTITNSSTLTVSTLTTNTTKSGTFAGNITDGMGTVALTKAGTGVLTLSGSNSYSGATTLAAGGLNLANASAIGSGTLVISGASTLDNTSGSALALAENNAQAWNADFTFKGSSNLDLGNGAVRMNGTRSVTVTSNTLTVGGVISSTSASAGLTKLGEGTLVLGGNSTYAGVTTIKSGKLQIGDSGTSGSVGSGAILNYGTVAFNRSDDITVGNWVYGPGGLVKDGSGSLTLTYSNNTYSGGTIINQGKLILGNSNAIGVPASDLTVNGGALDLHGHNVTVALLTGPGGSLINDGATTARLTTSSAKSGTFAGLLVDGTAPLAFTKAGTGTLTLTGSNGFSGGATLAGGGLNIGHANALGSGLLTISAATVIDNTTGSDLLLANDLAQNWNADFTFKGSSNLDLGKGNVLMNATRNLTVSGKLTVGGTISGATAAAGLTKNGTGTLALTADNAYTGVTTVNAGFLQLGNGGTSGSIASSSLVNSGTVAFRRSDSVTYGGIISGRGVIRQQGSGTLTLTGNNTHSGGTVLDTGALHVGSAKALGTGSLTLNSGILATNGTQKQINVGGNLLWDSDAKISLSLAGPTTSETVNVAGSLVALDGGVLTFVFDDAGFQANTPVAILSAARGFGSLTAANFAFESDDPITGTFFIAQNKLYFTNGMPIAPTSTGAVGVSSSTLALAGNYNFGSLTLAGSGVFNGGSGATLNTGWFDGSGYTLASFGNYLDLGQSGGVFTVNNLTAMGGPITVVPEPSTWALFLASLAFLIGACFKGKLRARG